MSQVRTKNGIPIEPGMIVLGPFWSDGEHLGVGIVVKRGRSLWTRVGEGYVPVKVINGDCVPGGYRPEGLIATGYRATGG